MSHSITTTTNGVFIVSPADQAPLTWELVVNNNASILDSFITTGGGTTIGSEITLINYPTNTIINSDGAGGLLLGSSGQCIIDVHGAITSVAGLVSNGLVQVNGNSRFYNTNSSAINTIIRGAVGQTGDLLNIQDSSSDVLVAVKANGNVVFGNLPTSPVGLSSGTLYNNFGVLCIV